MIWHRGIVLMQCIACAIMLGGASPPPAPFQLLSIKLPELGPDEYIDAFSIDTQSVGVVSVCQIPFGWKVTAGIDDSVTGELSGQAGLGVTFINAQSRYSGEIKDIFLVDIPAYTSKWNRTLPPTFIVKLTIGRYRSPDFNRTIDLDAANIIRTPAARCPDPVR